uniref:Uncharacterized protein n=1 Tax=Anguilla anguilla TaxID=7936 RepID=A0A0E9S8J5_ANGAN
MEIWAYHRLLHISNNPRPA